MLIANDHIVHCAACRRRLTAAPAEASLEEQDSVPADHETHAEEAEAEPERPRSLVPLGVALLAAIALATFVYSRSTSALKAAPPPVPKENVTIVKDAAGAVTLSDRGRFAGPAGLSDTQQALLAEILKNGKLPAAAVPAELAPAAGALVGSGSGTEVLPVGPIGIVAEDRPQFEWRPIAGAAAYRVSVFDRELHEISSSGAVTATAWLPPEALPRGVMLIWQVTPQPNGQKNTAPAPRAPAPLAPRARFQIIAEGDSDAILGARVQQPPSHLLLAALYAKAGMRADAAREIAILAALNPDSEVVKRLGASLP